MNMGRLYHKIQMQIGVEPETDRQREPLLLEGEESSIHLLSIMLIVAIINSWVLSFYCKSG